MLGPVKARLSIYVGHVLVVFAGSLKARMCDEHNVSLFKDAGCDCGAACFELQPHTAFGNEVLQASPFPSFVTTIYATCFLAAEQILKKRNRSR